jgi:hypothetical protein
MIWAPDKVAMLKPLADESYDIASRQREDRAAVHLADRVVELQVGNVVRIAIGPGQNKRNEPAGARDMVTGGFRYNHAESKWQYDLARRHDSEHQALGRDLLATTHRRKQLRSIVVPADHDAPIVNARVQDFEVAESNYQTVSQPPGRSTRRPAFRSRATRRWLLRTASKLTTQPYGPPVGLTQPRVQMRAQGYVRSTAVKLPAAWSVSANGQAYDHQLADVFGSAQPDDEQSGLCRGPQQHECLRVL